MPFPTARVNRAGRGGEPTCEGTTGPLDGLTKDGRRQGMARKKIEVQASEPIEVLVRLQDSMSKLQRDTDALVKRTQRQATDFITRDQRKAVERLFKQAQRLRGDLEKRALRASKDIESRAERFLSTLEKETAKRLAPVLKRLDLPTRHEVQTLSQRVSELERAMRPAKVSKPRAPRKRASAPAKPPQEE